MPESSRLWEAGPELLRRSVDSATHEAIEAIEGAERRFRALLETAPDAYVIADRDGRLVLVNPRIVEASGAEVGREGCLSIPELTANVRRATAVVVESADGVIRSEGFEARCLQHELDHLDGLLFLDRVDSLTADVFRRKRRG